MVDVVLGEFDDVDVVWMLYFDEFFEVELGESVVDGFVVDGEFFGEGFFGDVGIGGEFVLYDVLL